MLFKKIRDLSVIILKVFCSGFAFVIIVAFGTFVNRIHALFSIYMPSECDCLGVSKGFRQYLFRAARRRGSNLRKKAQRQGISRYKDMEIRENLYKKFTKIRWQRRRIKVLYVSCLGKRRQRKLKVEQIVKKREVEKTTEKNFEEPKVKDG